jgi:hypothetical protein
MRKAACVIDQNTFYMRKAACVIDQNTFYMRKAACVIDQGSMHRSRKFLKVDTRLDVMLSEQIECQSR